ncbi:MAG: nucleotidyltransferase family protein, partial [Acidobacteriaceae bacterium]
PKALLDIQGKPMIQWVLDALEGAQQVENVVLIGLDEKSTLTCAKPLTCIPNQITMIENILGGINKVLEVNPQAKQVLLASSDTPGITAEMVDWEIATACQLDADICYTVATRQVVEARYPASRRTFVKLKDVEVCGGDLNVVRTSLASTNLDIWKKLIEARKNPLKQAAILGLDTLFLVLLHMLTLDQAVSRVTSRLRLKGRAIVTPYAEMAMDVDKPFQLEMMKADLANRAGY